ncbi:MAG: hypothetical protein KAJ14_02705 [Candidatus Omnitrophica bacterium]|nr:hypothetical protein [Candidatus Omnitrophota bacterium]
MFLYNIKFMRLKGQSTMEYAGIIVCVAAALLSMQFFVMRAMNGRLRVAGDEIGEQHSVLLTKSKFTEVSASKVKIFPYIHPLTDVNWKPLEDSSGQEIYGLEIDYGIDESRTKTGTVDISGY